MPPSGQSDRLEVVVSVQAHPASPDASGRARRTAIGLSAAAVLGLILLSIAPWPLLLPKVRVSGTVREGTSEQPLGGVRVISGPSATMTDADGRFAFERASLAEPLVVEADGYAPGRVMAWPPGDVRITLAPRSFSVSVRDAETGELVAGAGVSADPARVQPLEPGRFQAGPARRDGVIRVRAAGYRELAVPYRGEADVEVKLAPRLIGSVIDSTTGKTIPSAFLSFEGGSVEAARDGLFELNARPSGVVRVLAPGYRRADVDLSAGRSLAIRLEPLVVKALYLTYYGIGDRGLRSNALELADKTEVNALVIDIKGDRGFLAYRSSVPLADRIGANSDPTIPNVQELLASLKQRGLYTIARIVVFKDDKLARNGARAGLDAAIKDARTGELWIDGEGLAWTDPTRQEVWDYNIALAREAAENGFDEVQFDYVRFPTDPSRGATVGSAVYSKFLSDASRVEAITTFLRRARAEVRAAGGLLGVDTFGVVTWNDDDSGIGQQLETLAEVTDYLCPMVYPSTYRAGLPGLIGYPQVVSRPYDVVFESLRRARERTEGHGAVLRPWLQYFDDYPWETRRPYNAAEIVAQKRGAADAGVVGWMMWDPANRYSRGGLGPKS